MSRAFVNQICAAHPGATAADPTTELDSWKVGGKMFACFGDRIDGVCVKTDSIDTAAMLIETGAASRAPYFHKSWVLVSLAPAESCSNTVMGANRNEPFAKAMAPASGNC